MLNFAILIFGFQLILWVLFVFKRKRSCFAPFSKRFASTLIVFVSFSPVHTTTPYPFWKRCYTLSAHAQMNSCAFQCIGPAKLARNWSHMVASVRHFGYSPSSGLAPGRVYFDDAWWRHRFQIASFSPSELEKQCFQKASFANRSTLEKVFEWLRFWWSFSAD